MVDMKLELVHVPVSDVDRARNVYVERCGLTRGPVPDVATTLYCRFEDPDGNSWLLQQWAT